MAKDLKQSDKERSAEQGQEEAIAFLSSPAAWGGAVSSPDEIDIITTHGAWVFLAGDKALKLKRAVKFDYMDFSTLERRRRFCEAELTLNRRTAPEIYLGVRAVIRDGKGEVTLTDSLLPGAPPPGGEVLDWVVEMRRFQQSGLFDRMACEGRLDAPLIERLAEEVAAFHARAERRHDFGSADVTREVIEVCMDQFAHFPEVFRATEAESLRSALLRELDRQAARIDQRRAQGFVRHCHGDLHLHNICLFEDRPTLFDCIEFNESFAVNDVLYDFGFLLMDLMHRDLGTLGNAALNRYLAASGAYDDPAAMEGLALLPLFLAMRAAIRAHVSATIAAGLGPGKEEEAQALRQEGRRYQGEAESYLAPPPPRLFAVGGFSGSGKSTLARALAPDLGAAPGAVILRSDVIRKWLMGAEETQPLPPEAYLPEVSQRVYQLIRENAATALSAGRTVIADAVYDRADERTAIEAVATEAGTPFEGLWLAVPPEIMARRIAAREKDASDATVKVLEMQLAKNPPATDWRQVDGSGDVKETLARARQVLAR